MRGKGNRILLFGAILFCIALLIPVMNVQASTKLKYTTSKKSYSQKYKGKVVANGDYTIVTVKGTSKAAKNANKYANQRLKEFKKEWKYTKESALKAAAKGSLYVSYSCYLSQEVTASTSKYISIATGDGGFTGGAHPWDSVIGKTYDRKTGKELSLNKLLGTSNAGTKKKIVKALSAYKNDTFVMEQISKCKSKDYRYYVKGKYVYVTFANLPYAARMVEAKIKLA